MNDRKPDIVTGLSCSGCGTRFVEPHGHPVLCAVCYDDFYRGHGAIHGNNVPPSQRIQKATNAEA